MLRCLQIFVIVSMPAQKIFIAGAGAEKCRKLLDFIDLKNLNSVHAVQICPHKWTKESQ